MKILFGNGAGDKITMNFPIIKSEKLEDGRLMIEGVVTSEAVDSANEVIDYETAKAAFSTWTGNIREQHDPKKAVGKAVEVLADDENKQIIIKAFISKGAQDTQEKVMDGTLSAFSMGGSSSKREKQTISKGDGSTAEVTRVFVKRVSETSVVDSGANPETAFAIIKADGDALYYADDEAENPAIDALADMLNKGDITPERLLDLAKSESDKKEDGEDDEEGEKDDAGDSPDESGDEKGGKEKDAEKGEPAGDIEKGMYGVSRFAELLQCLCNLTFDVEWEAQHEGDNSPVPAALRNWLGEGAKILQDMAKEEVDEMLELLNKQGEANIEASDSSIDIAKAGAKFSAKTKKALKDLHEAMKNAIGQLDALGYEDDDTEKADDGEDLGKAQAANEDIMKAASAAGYQEGESVAEFIEKMANDNETLKAKVEELGQQPAAGKALLKAVAISKAEDNGGTEEASKAEQDDVEKLGDVAASIKKVHQSGVAR